MSPNHTVCYCQSCGARLARDNRRSQCTPCEKKASGLQVGPPDLPASFWTTTVMADAFASWHIGQVIRAYRHHPFHGLRPLPQELVARWLGLTQTQLSRIENGLPVKDLDKLTAWACVLKMPPAQLWFSLPGEPRRDTASATTDLSFAPPGMTPAVLTTMAPVNDDQDLAAMQAFRAADRQVGGGHLYATVLSYLQTALAPRLYGAADASHGQRVFTAASALTEMAGWMAHDAGRDEAAARHFQRSIDLATVGGDRQLTAHVMGSMSHLALHRGEPSKAIRLARQGQSVLTSAPPNPRLAARLLAMEARGLAALPSPEPATCGKVLLTAERALGKDQPDPGSPWISSFDEGSLASEAARCLRQLGQLEAAARQAQRIIEIRPSSRARSRAFGQLLLASVLIAQGKPEDACLVARKALDATQSLSSYLVVQQLRELAALLQPSRDNQEVAAYLTAVEDALRQRHWLDSWLTAGGA